jgi:hypothetical protein
MSVDVLDILSAADPAAGMPDAAPDDRERLRRAIIATPLDPRRRPGRRHSRRRLTLIAVSGAIVLIGGTAAYGGLRDREPALKPVPQPPPIDAPSSVFQAKGFMDWKQYRAEYTAWTHKIALPPGAEWRGGDPGTKGSSRYVGAGAIDAVWEGMGHWAKEWIAATKGGAHERAARAEAWVRGLRALLRTGNDETRSAMDQQNANLLDSAIAEAAKGHFEKLRDMVVPYTIPWTTPARVGGR